MERWWASQNEQILLLNLTRVKGIGPARLRHLLKIFHKPSKILSASSQDLASFAGINKEVADAILQSAADDFGTRQLESLKKNDARLISLRLSN